MTIPALGWASYSMDVEATRDEARRERELAERAGAREDALIRQGIRDKLSIAQHGYSEAELVQWRQEQEAERAERAERVAELEAELDRLDPRRIAARREQASRTSSLDSMERTLAQARELARDPEMLRFRREYHQREISRQRQYHESALGYLEISRTCGVGWPA
jgi:hypothetical protein